MELSDGERLILLMLCDIQKGDPVKREIDPDFVQQSILSNQLWGLSHKYQNLLPGRFEYPAEVSEVIDILDMYRLLDRHYGYMSPEDKKRVDEAAPFGEVKFPGFDSHDTGGHTGAARYMVEDVGLFKEFKGNIDSGVNTLDRFRRMLRIFLPLRDTLGDGNMTVEQMLSVLKAG
jgi:uncharacterized protein YfbU (UPF0304 family)